MFPSSDMYEAIVEAGIPAGPYDRARRAGASHAGAMAVGLTAPGRLESYAEHRRTADHDGACRRSGSSGAVGIDPNDIVDGWRAGCCVDGYVDARRAGATHDETIEAHALICSRHRPR